MNAVVGHSAGGTPPPQQVARWAPSTRRWWRGYRSAAGSLLAPTVILAVGIVCSITIETSVRTAVASGVTALAVALAVTVPSTIERERDAFDMAETAVRRAWIELGVSIVGSNASRVLGAVVTAARRIPEFDLQTASVPQRCATIDELLMAVDLYWATARLGEHPFVRAPDPPAAALIRAQDKLLKVIVGSPTAAEDLLEATNDTVSAALDLADLVRGPR